MWKWRRQRTNGRPWNSPSFYVSGRASERRQEIRRYFEVEGIKLPLAASIGVKEEGYKRAEILADLGVDIVTIDIAHGDSVMMYETLEKVKGLPKWMSLPEMSLLPRVLPDD